MFIDRSWDAGPFDIIGDVHGCFDELIELLHKLGYHIQQEQLQVSSAHRYVVTHPHKRKLVFVGDLVDRGPAIVSVLRLVMDACEAQSALAVLGNHDYKLYRKLKGNEVIVRHGLAESLAQLEPCPDLFLQRTKQFLGRLPCHYILANAGLIVAHAGLKEKYHGVDSKSACFFALYGETTGEIDQYGYPIRADWAANYRGDAVVVYGHTPLVDTAWMNNTLCVDLGCVFGGRLAALRYPERDIVSVAAHQEYCPHRHFEA